MTAKIPKYKAKHVYWNAKTRSVISSTDIEIYRCHSKLELPKHYWRFDSTHEFKVYLELVRIFGADRIIRQYKLEVLPGCCCYPSGKHWRVDFAIIGLAGEASYSHYIEAKGAFLPEFGTTLGMLEVFNDFAFDRTYIVFAGAPPKKNRVVSALQKTPVKHRLFTLKQLQKLQNLP